MRQLCLVIVLGAHTPALTQDTTFFRYIDRAKDKVYRVEDADSTFLGTAFTVNRYGNLLTCAHVVGSRDTVFLASYIDISPEGQPDSISSKYRVRFAAAVDTVIHQFDLAVLKVTPETYRMTRFAFFALQNSDEIREGQDIAICAFIPDDFTLPKPFISRGIISTIRSKLYDPRLNNRVAIIQMDLNISKGTSGGPIFSPRTGRVLAIQNAGIFESKQSSQTPFAIALTINQVATVLDSLNIPYSMK